jgi:hypothetical protein
LRSSTRAVGEAQAESDEEAAGQSLKQVSAATRSA